MAIVLQALGVAFLLLILFLVVAVLTIRAKLRSFARNLDGMAKAAGGSLTPARLHLRAMAAPSWADEPAVAAQTAPLPDLGFALAGTYQAEEIPGLNLQAWVQPETAVTAVVYEHPIAGVWTDVVTRYEDDTRLTYANILQGQGVDHAPGHSVERFDGIGSRELYERHLADRPDRPKVVPTAEGFVARFEKAYADEMDWRNSRGGTTEEEIRAIARLSGESYDEDVIQQTRRMEEARAMEQLGESIRERFLAETRMSASEWEEVRDRLVIVHDAMTQQALEDVFTACEWDEDDEYDDEHEDGAESDRYPRLDGSPERTPRRLFEAFNAALPPARRCRKVGTVSQPVAADLYAAPEDE